MIFTWHKTNNPLPSLKSKKGFLLFFIYLFIFGFFVLAEQKCMLNWLDVGLSNDFHYVGILLVLSNINDKKH